MMVDIRSVEVVTTGGDSRALIAAGVATDTPISLGKGRLCRINVLSDAASAMTFTDGAGGPVIAAIPAGALTGEVYDLQVPIQAGIVAVGNAGNPSVAVTFY